MLTRYQRLRRLMADAGVQLFSEQPDALTSGALWRIRCVECDARLPLREWIAGERVCPGCYMRQLAALARLIAEVEQRKGQAPERLPLDA